MAMKREAHASKGSSVCEDMVTCALCPCLFQADVRGHRDGRALTPPTSPPLACADRPPPRRYRGFFTTEGVCALEMHPQRSTCVCEPPAPPRRCSNFTYARLLTRWHAVFIILNALGPLPSVTL